MTVTTLTFECLAESLYTVRELCPSLAVLGINWMHPKHPIHPVQQDLMRQVRAARDTGVYGGRTQVESGELSAGELLRQVGRCLANAGRQSARLVRLRRSLGAETGVLAREPFDVVVKTWCFAPERPPDGRDFYYGDLQRRLLERGVRTLLLCGDSSGARWEAFAKGHISLVAPWRLPELCLVPPLAPIRMGLRQIDAAVRLRRLAARAQDQLVRRVSERASLDCLGAGASVEGLFYWVGRNATATWHPRAFVTLYEGHGWEKCCWWGAKVGNACSITVGYQHTVVFPHSLSLLRPQPDSRTYSVPEVVLCLGERTRRMLEPGHGPARSRLITFGSFRRERDREVRATPRPARRTVLALPEGLAGEATLLFDAALKLAGLLPDHRIVLRCHPVLPFSRVRPLLEASPEAYPNVEVSERPDIGDDYARSSVVLYRGSSAVLYAVLRGLKPLYLHDAGHPDVDPLFELDAWREIVASPEEVAEGLRRYAAVPEKIAADEWRRAAEYVESYTVPVDEGAIDGFLAAVGLEPGAGVR